MEQDIQNMRYAELRKYCKSLGLSCSGKVSNLYESVRNQLLIHENMIYRKNN